MASTHMHLPRLRVHAPSPPPNAPAAAQHRAVKASAALHCAKAPHLVVTQQAAARELAIVLVRLVLTVACSNRGERGAAAPGGRVSKPLSTRPSHPHALSSRPGYTPFTIPPQQRQRARAGWPAPPTPFPPPPPSAHPPSPTPPTPPTHPPNPKTALKSFKTHPSGIQACSIP